MNLIFSQIDLTVATIIFFTKIYIIKLIIGSLLLIYLSFNDETKKIIISFFFIKEKDYSFILFRKLQKLILFYVVLMPSYLYFESKTFKASLLKTFILIGLFLVMLSFEPLLCKYFLGSILDSYCTGWIFSKLYQKKYFLWQPFFRRQTSENDAFIVFLLMILSIETKFFFLFL